MKWPRLGFSGGFLLIINVDTRILVVVVVAVVVVLLFYLIFLQFLY